MYNINSCKINGGFEVNYQSELLPIFDSRKSFYNKAIVINLDDNSKLLKSYDSFVCLIDSNNSIYINNDIEHELLYSTTTLRHIKEFIKQFSDFENKNELTKKDLLNMYDFHIC